MPGQELCKETFKFYQFGTAKHKHTFDINYTTPKIANQFSIEIIT
jgi:hypothetical protein